MVKENEFMLTNQEILGGLQAAVERGQTLKEAMMSFYQAGYKKAEIEDAAKAYLYLQRGAPELDITKRDDGYNPQQMDKAQEDAKTVQGKTTSVSEELKKKEIPHLTNNSQETKTPQKVSDYSTTNPTGKARSHAITVILIVVLLSLLGILASVVLFKEELIGFFNGLFNN